MNAITPRHRLVARGDCIGVSIAVCLWMPHLLRCHRNSGKGVCGQFLVAFVNCSFIRSAALERRCIETLCFEVFPIILLLRFGFRSVLNRVAEAVTGR